MKKFPLIIGIVSIVLLIGGVLLLSKGNKGEVASESTSSFPPASHEYFWSKTCSHCATVAEFMESWGGKDKIEIDKKEVSSPANSNLFRKRGADCNIAPNQLGVPFLVTPGGECLIGDEPIINYFENLNL